MARSPISARPGFAGGTQVKGLEDLKRRLYALPQALHDQVVDDLYAGAYMIKQTAVRIAPVGVGPFAGELRDSIRVERGQHGFNVRIIADGRSADGKAMAAHVEYGHKAADGTKVAAHPFFWPAYRVNKTKIVSKVNRGSTKAIRSVIGNGQ